MRRVLKLIRAAALAGANYSRHSIDVRLIRLIVKGSITGIVVYAILAVVSWMLSFFSDTWLRSYIELVHELFASIGFTMSCILDLKRYSRKPNRKPKTPKDKR